MPFKGTNKEAYKRAKRGKTKKKEVKYIIEKRENLNVIQFRK